MSDGQVEVAREGKVAAVVCGHGHDGASAVVGQYVVADPNRDALLCDGIDGIRAREYAAHFLDLGLALALGAVLGPCYVGFHFLLLLGCGDLFDHLMLRTQYHEGYTEDGVRACSEDFKGHLILQAINIAPHVDFLPVVLTFLS